MKLAGNTIDKVGKHMQTAERAMVAVIVVAATICVGLITAYVCMFDARGILH